MNYKCQAKREFKFKGKNGNGFRVKCPVYTPPPNPFKQEFVSSNSILSFPPPQKQPVIKIFGQNKYSSLSLFPFHSSSSFSKSSSSSSFHAIDCWNLTNIYIYNVHIYWRFCVNIFHEADLKPIMKSFLLQNTNFSVGRYHFHQTHVDVTIKETN